LGFRKNTGIALSEGAKNDRQYVKSLARGLALLQVFSADDRGLSNADLARRTGFPKATISRITFTLMALGYLHFNEDTGRYALHPHILTLGYPVLRQLSIRDVARPLMQDLADDTQSAVALGIRDGLNMIVIERTRHHSMMVVPVDIGVGRKIATSAMGRAYLAALTPEERDQVLDTIKTQNLDAWPRQQPRIDAALRSYELHGYTISAGDWMSDYNAVGVPLRMANGTILSFNCGGIAQHIPKTQLAGLGQRLVEMVKTLARSQDLLT
jgi:DNA-binding IclR family transcriptional regulator